MVVFAKLMAFVIGIIIGVSAFSIPYFNRIAAVENKAELKVNDQIFVVDVVRNPEERAQGLAGRDRLGINEGMLFVFENPGMYGFWMKDMKIPIDIVWIHNNAIVGYDEYVFPEPDVPDADLKVYYPPEPVEKVLELPAGRAKLFRASVGDRILTRPLLEDAFSLSR